ncbi:gliding motility-associated C-terminal domain-containing protein [uncultured Salegentibacter sp.]|uniref:T9SS type B sorting domain-containing protein n=1 Tax=uncultured Salegentibacter sp. TaxID=259320 RepID=UPI00259799CB|nr:gliding motility-associated C-terminal domain-containing protein [uncultured Salegentibacter sp.]
MQNFTFGRKGTNWFLFAFVLLIGTLPSFGQDCPTLDNPNPGVFCYLQDINDLTAVTNPDDTVEWYRDAALTQPIQASELLENTTYYAGNPEGDCNNPIAVTVIVEIIPAPVSSYGNVYSPHIGSEGEVRQINDLTTPISTTAGADEIVVYTTEFGTTTYSPGDVLVAGQSYFIGQTDSNSPCYSERIAIRYSPDVAPAPIAESTQTFCEGATVADLEATATSADTQAFRWYSTATSNPALLETDELQPGTYYVSQIVNDEGDPFPPAESEDRTEVTVEIVAGPDAGEQAGDGTVCESNVDATFPSIDAVRNFYLELLEEGIPTDGTFSPSIATIVGQYQNSAGLGNFTTTYTIGEDNCQDSVELTISVVPAEDAEAGDNFSDSYCIDQNQDFDLFSFLSDDAVESGEFSAPFENGIFNPSVEGAGTYTITYFVNEDNSCVNGSDQATFTLEVNEINEENITINIDPSDIEGMNESEALQELSIRFAPYFDGIPDFNAFQPELEVVFAGLDIQNPQGTYTTSYSGNSCEILNFTIIIEEETDPLPPGDPTGTVCETDVQTIFPSNDEVRKYYLALLPSGTPTNGSFTPSIDAMVDIYQADEDGLGDFTTTYTVNNESFELTISVIPTIEADAGTGQTVNYCTGAGEQNLYNLLSDNANQNGIFEGYEDGTFDPSVEGEGNYEITYRVSDDIACVTGSATATFNITVSEGNANAGSDATGVVCAADVQNTFPSINAIENYYLDLLDSGVSREGTFDPTPAELAELYQNDEDGLGDFTTTYTVSEEACEASVQLTVSVIGTEPADAGEIDDQELCANEGMIDLSQYLEGSGAVEGGIFTGEGVTNNMFDSSIGSNEDGYTITYTVSEDNDACVEGEASTTFTIIINDSPNAGSNNSTTLCNQDILDGMFEGSEALVREFYLELLDEGVSRDGTFNPSLQDFIDQYDSGEQIGTFTTVYTVGTGACTDSVELSLTVVETIDAEVGEIVDQTLCSSDDDLNLYSLITSGNEDGTFEGYEDGVFSPSMMGAGTYEITYTVGEDIPCVEGEASTTFSVEVLQGADAGGNLAVNLCTNDETQDLYSLLSAGADMDGEFTLNGEVITNGTMDPSAFDAGVYEVTYTVEAQGDDCGGDDVSTITITLGDAPEAPTTGETLAFCAIDAPTADLLVADGTNLTWYSDADLSMMVSDDDLLVNGDYYVTQTADNGCESEAAVLTVNIVDSPAPTINSDYELCTFDDPTLSDLSDEINEAGTITWYDSADSMTALSNNTMLADGTTYYATLISDNGCESSERLAVTVTLEDCELLFPEAITPNDDGKNDIFVVEKLEREYPNFNITIFNRWGNAVYKGNASTPEWDGTSNQSGNLGDDVLPVGVYFYVVDFNDGSTEPRQGKVYLNR